MAVKRNIKWRNVFIALIKILGVLIVMAENYFIIALYIQKYTYQFGFYPIVVFNALCGLLIVLIRFKKDERKRLKGLIYYTIVTTILAFLVIEGYGRMFTTGI